MSSVEQRALEVANFEAPLTIASIMNELQVRIINAQRQATSITERSALSQSADYQELAAIVNTVAEHPAKASQVMWHLSASVANLSLR